MPSFFGGVYCGENRAPIGWTQHVALRFVPVDDHASSCTRCQATLHAASALRSKKLGKHERRQLLAAAAPESEPTPIVPPGPSHDDRTATRRAVATLRKAGLIELAPDAARVTPETHPDLLRRMQRKYTVLRFAWRTPLGEEIVARYRHELERPGTRIRWQLRLGGARDAALLRCPERRTSSIS